MTTRRFAVALLSVCMAVASFAANKDLEKDITMVSYGVTCITTCEPPH